MSQDVNPDPCESLENFVTDSPDVIFSKDEEVKE